MELQFHLEITSWSFGRGMAFPNFVYLGATTGGDSNSSYKLQEPARMPSKGTCPDPTSCTKGFGSETHSFSLTLSVCVDCNVTLRYRSTVTLCYCPTSLSCQRVPQGPKGVWRLRPVEEQCRSRRSPHPQLSRVTFLHARLAQHGVPASERYFHKLQCFGKQHRGCRGDKTRVICAQLDPGFEPQPLRSASCLSCTQTPVPLGSVSTCYCPGSLHRIYQRASVPDLIPR